MIGSWKIGAQLSTSHSFRDSLDPLGMVETVRRVQEEIDLDFLIVGWPARKIEKNPVHGVGPRDRPDLRQRLLLAPAVRRRHADIPLHL